MISIQKILPKNKSEIHLPPAISPLTVDLNNPQNKSTEKNDKNLSFLNNVSLTQIAKGNQEVILTKMKSAQNLFAKKYLGNKDFSKTIDLKNVLKVPSMKDHNSQRIFVMKTGNLNLQIKQIQTIFKADRKNKTKKRLIQTDLTDFDLYLAKRDILKEKNQVLDQIRKQYLEDKRKQQKKKLKRSHHQKILNEDYEAEIPQIKQKIKESRLNPQTKQPVTNVSQLEIIDENPQNFINLKNNEPQVLDTGSYLTEQIGLVNQSNAKKRSQVKETNIIKPFDDIYFQKQFEDQIIRNKIDLNGKPSIKTLLEPSSKKRKTTMNQRQFIKNELDQIENLAKSTIQNFETKQKINKALYSNGIQFDEHQSEMTSKRTTPAQVDFSSLTQTEEKSIEWIIKECEGFKKRFNHFNVRKSRSVNQLKTKQQNLKFQIGLS